MLRLCEGGQLLSALLVTPSEKLVSPEGREKGSDEKPARVWRQKENPDPVLGLENPIGGFTMKLVKSLLLGSAAGLMAVTGSMAADLPSRKAAPVDYVRVCSGGAGHTGFVVPGSADNCLMISGRVRADYLVGKRFSKADDAYGILASSRLNLDYRQQTGIGTVRAYVRLDMSNPSGRPDFFFAGNTSRNSVTLGGATLATGTVAVVMSRAFIQFGLGSGFVTAGRSASFFEYYGEDMFWSGRAISGTQGSNANVLAYTANFGGGFTGTLGIEDRSVSDLASNARALGVAVVAGVPQPVLAVANTNLLYQGRPYPDLVGNLRLSQGWGSAMFAAALRNVSVTNYSLAAPITGSKTGFALLGGVSMNTPALGAGSAIVFEGTYTRGMLNYIGLGSSVRQGYANVAVADFASDVGTGRINLSEGYSLVAALRAVWTPTLRQHVFFGYTNVSYGSLGNAPVVDAALPTLSAITGLRSFSKFEIGTNFLYTIAPGLNLGVEVIYQNVDPRGRFTYTNANNVASSTSSQSAVEGRFRIQRDF
jgi:hypothetical protein